MTEFNPPAGMQTWSFGVIEQLSKILVDSDMAMPVDGPWIGEPDKAQWVDEVTDYDCLIVRNHTGALCGYVGVPSSHRLHGADWGDVTGLFDAANGVNYSDLCQEGAPYPRGICHLPVVGRPARVWWFGFDCGNMMWDVVPSVEGIERKMRLKFPDSPIFDMAKSFMPVPTYKNIGHVQQVVTSLAQQLAAHA